MASDNERFDALPACRAAYAQWAAAYAAMRASEAAMEAAEQADWQLARRRAQFEANTDEKVGAMAVEAFRRIPPPGRDSFKRFQEV